MAASKWIDEDFYFPAEVSTAADVFDICARAIVRSHFNEYIQFLTGLALNQVIIMN